MKMNAIVANPYSVVIGSVLLSPAVTPLEWIEDQVSGYTDVRTLSETPRVAMWTSQANGPGRPLNIIATEIARRSGAIGAADQITGTAVIAGADYTLTADEVNATYEWLLAMLPVMS